MKKIVFFDANEGDEAYFSSAFRNVLKSEIVFCSEPLNKESVAEFTDTAIASVFVTSDVDEETISRMPQLELIATRSTGYDHIDIKEAKKHHALVSTVPTYGETTVAEYTFMLLLSLVRRLQESLSQIDSGVINYQDITGSDLAGKTLGIVGCGRIGQHVARIAQGFEMNAIGFDVGGVNSENISAVDLPVLIAESDVISLHLPGGEETFHFIDSEKIEKMKNGVIILNTARGELIDTKALTDGLYSGKIGGAGLDVIEGEELLRFDEEMALLHPEAQNHDLLLKTEHSILQRMPNVILTPHNAFNSAEALERIRYTTAENIKQFMMHDPQNLAGGSSK